MKLLDRYLLREMAPTFLGAAATFVVLLVGHMLYTVVEVVVERGVPLPSVMRFLALKTPGAAVMALPVSALLASALAFNRLAADSELPALRAAGVGMTRLMAPAAALGLVAALLVLLLNEALAPRCEEASRRLLIEAVSQQRTLAFQPRRFLELSSTAFVYPDDVDSARERLLGVRVFLLRGDDPPALMEAPEAAFVGQELIVPRARSLVPEWNGDVTWGRVGELRIPLTAEALSLPGGAGEMREMSMAALYRRWREHASKYPAEAARASLELHSRLAMAGAALVFALLAAPLTLAVGKGRSLSGVALSLLVVFAYYLVMLWARLLGERGALPPLVAAWGENALLIVVTGWLTYRLR